MASCCDPVSVLPFDVVSKIFLHVELQDLFKNCARVSKAWNALLISNKFWHDLIRDEFGSNAASRFISANNGAADSLRKVLTKDCFSRDLLDEVDILKVEQRNRGDVDSLASFTAKLAADPLLNENPTIWLETVTFPGQPQTVIVVINSAALLQTSNADVLDFFIRVTPRVPAYSSCLWPCIKFAFLDSNLQPVSSGKPYTSGPLHRLRPGTHYVLVQMPLLKAALPALRFLMPSHGLRYAKLMKTIQWFSLQIGGLISPRLCDKIRAVFRRDRDLLNWTFDGVTPLMYAVSLSNFNAISLSLIEMGANVHKKLCDHTTALTRAVLSRNTGAVEILLNHGADPNAGENRMLPLFCALFPNYSSNMSAPSFEIAELLIHRGANVEARVGDETLLMHAVARCHESAVDFLLHHGADFTVKTTDGRTLFDISAPFSPIWQMLMAKQCQFPYPL